MASCRQRHRIDPSKGKCKYNHPVAAVPAKPNHPEVERNRQNRQNPAGTAPVGEFETHKPDGTADYCRFSQGESSASGMLAFLTSGNEWSELRIL